MGADVIKVTARGLSMQDAFEKAVREAEREYGNDIYNGAINNCALTKDVTKRYNQATTKEQQDRILGELIDETEKREVVGIELEPPVKNTNKIKTTVEVYPNKGAREWETTFEVERSFDPDCSVVAVAKTQKEAIIRARKLCEENKESYEVVLRKRLKKGNSRVARITYKRSNNEKEGKYLFIGWAPI